MSAKVISVEARKGGPGKTTIAAHLAVDIARRVAPKSVLYVHLDPQGDAVRAFGLRQNGRCISKLLLDEAVPGDVIMRVPLDEDDSAQKPDLHILPATDRLSSAIDSIQDQVGRMRELYDKMTPAMRKRQGLEQIEDLTDIFVNALMPFKTHPKGPAYIILDCPPSLGSLQLGVHKLADWAVVPTRLGDRDVAMTVRHTQQLAEDMDRGGITRLLAVVPNMAKVNLKIHNDLMATLLKEYGRRGLLFEPIPDRTAIDQAQATGKTIFDYDPSCDAVEVFHRLTDKVMSAR